MVSVCIPCVYSRPQSHLAYPLLILHKLLLQQQMIMHALHPEISQLASGSRIDGGQFGGGVGTDGLLLLASDALRLWRRLVLGLVLLVALFLVSVTGRSTGATEAGLVLALMRGSVVSEV